MTDRTESARVGGADSVEAACFWRRIFADLIDTGLLAFIGIVLWKSGLVTPKTLPEKRFDWIDYTAQLLADHHSDFYPFLMLTFVLNLLLIGLQRHFFRVTIGDRSLGIELIDYHGAEPAWWQGLVHSVATTLGVVILLQGYVWAAVDRDRQGLSNYLSRTLLVRRT